MILSDNFYLRKIEDTYVLLPVGQKIVDKASVYKISPETYTILSQLEQESTFDELLSRLKVLFEVDDSEAGDFRKMIEACVNDLAEKGIILTKMY